MIILLSPNISPLIQTVISGISLGFYEPDFNLLMGIFNPLGPILWIYTLYFVFTAFYLYDLDVVYKNNDIKDTKLFSVLYSLGYYVPVFLVTFFLTVIAGSDDTSMRIKLSLMSTIITFGIMTILVFIRIEFLGNINVTQFTNPIAQKVQKLVEEIQETTVAKFKTISAPDKHEIEVDAVEQEASRSDDI